MKFTKLLFLCFCIPLLSLAQPKVRTGVIHKTYVEYCASCHGQKGEGGSGGSLVDHNYKWGQTDEELAKLIKNGLLDAGMPAFDELLDSEETRAMVVYLRELKTNYESGQREEFSFSPEKVYKSNHHDFKIRKVVEVPQQPWSINYLNENSFLVSTKPGRLYILEDDQLSDAVQGLPKIWVGGQGGLLDVIAHPDYENNGWVYLSYADQSEEGKGSTRIQRGRIKDGHWVDAEDIFQSPAKDHPGRRVHFGCRMVVHNGYLFFSVGDRGTMDNAQNLDNDFGKIHRLHDDGRIPEDNPFQNSFGQTTSFWSIGNRNPQGLALHPTTFQIWESEHGPRGGDEINLIERGNNYGWPIITYGINYNGRPLTDITEAPGLEQPLTHWTPSIAVSGINFLQSKQFPKWNGDLFVASLSAQQLHRLKFDQNNQLVEEEIIVRNLGRIRDVLGASDGTLYLALSPRGKPGGMIYQILAD